MLETNTATVNSKDSDTADTTATKSDTAGEKPDIKKFQFKDYEHPGVPALYNPRPKPNEKRIPLAVFGFPITMRDKNDFAQRFDFDPSFSPSRRRAAALQKLISDIPDEYKRYMPLAVRIDYYKPAMCIVLGTNETEEDIYNALDMDMIEDVSEILQTYGTPGWYIPYGS